ncbi:tyrosine-protein kinase family protein [Dysgonomonas sp. Marseille-P4361]|uniref:tyrosine-protein kinase family protein n=1 Tax=Dysgonomonas sp. Marseille-P4361 TaxID=2161820 RepID=UPI000D55E70A|nr:tyrosine-protein kinase family protein [Dysgonomonas sp. Marseille-P4361]
MSVDNKKAVESDPYFENIKSKTNISFDFVLWFYRILKYWYLFVISVAICLGLAFLENKKWVPYSVTESMIILEPAGRSSVVAGAVPTNVLLRNTENQQIVLSSYGLTERTVQRLPNKMHVDYYFETFFLGSKLKRLSMYTDSPVEVVIDSLEQDIKPEAYQYTYTVSYLDEDRCEVSYKKNAEGEVGVKMIIPYGEVYENELFKLRLEKRGKFLPETKQFRKDISFFNFRFLSDRDLISMYNGRVSSRLYRSNSTILSISMTGADPGRDKDYMTCLLDEFQDYNLFLKNKQADLTINFLAKELKLITDSLDLSRHNLENLQKATGVYEVASPSLRIEMDSAEREIDALSVKDRSIMLLSQMVKESIDNEQTMEIVDPASLNINNRRLSELIEKYNEVLNKYKNLGDKNPLYYKTVDILTDYRISIAKEVQLMQIRLQDQKDALIRKYNVVQKKMDNLPPQERDLIKFQREYRFHEMYHQYLTQRKREAEIQKASNEPDNEIYEAPRIIRMGINGGQLSKNYMNYFIIGLIIPLVFVVLKEEVFNFSITTKEECEKLSGLPVIGTIENVSKKLANGVVLVKNYPKSSFAEAFRNMRVRIGYMAQREDKITVLVTSTEPADGKTFIATNIASVYQLTGKKVIIVDLDLRRPSVSKTLQMDTHKGISNYLIGQVTLEDIIITHPDYGFDVIPAGTLPPNPSELIKTDKTRQVLEHLQEMYDYVVIDCSPVGLVSDAYILSELVDTTLFVVRRAKTSKSFFKSVINQLKYDGVENIALVFNDVKGREGYYGTSRYYGDKTYYLKKNSYYHDDYFEN